MFLDAGKLDHAAWTLERAVTAIEAGGYASQRDTMMLHEHLAQLEHRRRQLSASPASPLLPGPPGRDAEGGDDRPHRDDDWERAGG